MALSQTGIRRWYLVHKWTSLICTAFLLLLCVTGLPLIFHHEIEELTGAHSSIEQVAGGGTASLDTMVEDAKRRAPAQVPGFLFWDSEKPLVAVVTASSLTDQQNIVIHYYDARSGAHVPAPPHDEGVMAFLLDLHKSLLMGLPGTLFLGLIGLIFAVAVVSGVVVYAPFMRKLAFGTVRKDRSPRVRSLDTHNMVGIVTLGWVMVVGLTGLILTMATPIALIWQIDELSEISAPYEGKPPPTRLASLDTAVAAARAAAPGGQKLSSVAWPGTMFSSKHHYMIAFSGETPLTERLIHPAFVDAETGRLTEIRDMPWYVKGLFLSVPLHFGDYGGMPLKIIWALLDIAAIIVLWTGLRLWFGRRRVPIEKRVEELRGGGVPEPAE